MMRTYVIAPNQDVFQGFFRLQGWEPSAYNSSVRYIPPAHPEYLHPITTGRILILTGDHIGSFDYGPYWPTLAIRLNQLTIWTETMDPLKIEYVNVAPLVLATRIPYRACRDIPEYQSRTVLRLPGYRFVPLDSR